MATDGEWADGYLEQARADLAAAGLLQGQAPSGPAMLFQMASEKLAKAALLRTGEIQLARAESTHRAATHMLQQLANRPTECRKLGIAPAVVRYQLVPLVHDLERHQPQLAGKRQPNLEYPYQQVPEGNVLYPARDLGVVQRLGATGTESALLLRLLDRLAERFDQIYPPSTPQV